MKKLSSWVVTLVREMWSHPFRSATIAAVWFLLSPPDWFFEKIGPRLSPYLDGRSPADFAVGVGIKLSLFIFVIWFAARMLRAVEQGQAAVAARETERRNEALRPLQEILRKHSEGVAARLAMAKFKTANERLAQIENTLRQLRGAGKHEIAHENELPRFDGVNESYRNIVAVRDLNVQVPPLRVPPINLYPGRIADRRQLQVFDPANNADYFETQDANLEQLRALRFEIERRLQTMIEIALDPVRGQVPPHI